MAKADKQVGDKGRASSLAASKDRIPQDPGPMGSGSGSGSGAGAGPSSNVGIYGADAPEAPEAIDVEDENVMRALIRGKGPMKPEERKRATVEGIKRERTHLAQDPDLVSQTEAVHEGSVRK